MRQENVLVSPFTVQTVLVATLSSIYSCLADGAD
jgi:hypothetical protein